MSRFVTFSGPVLVTSLPCTRRATTNTGCITFFGPSAPGVLTSEVDRIVGNSLFGFSSIPLMGVRLPRIAD